MIVDQPIESWRFIGLAALVLTLLGGVFIILRQPMGKDKSISAHAASTKLQSLVLSGALLLFGGLFYTSLLLWLLPTYDLPPILTPLLAMAFIAQLFVAWFPVSVNRGLGHRLHLIGGTIIAAVILICLIAIAFYSNLSMTSLSFWLVIVTIAYSFGCFVAYTFFNKRRRYFLIFECIYISAFAICIAALTLQI